MLEVHTTTFKCFQKLEIQTVYIQAQKMNLQKFRVNHWVIQSIKQIIFD